MNEPLSAAQAKALIRRIVEEGIVTYSRPHALERLQKHRMSILDVENVLKRGRVGEGEWENGGWRYPVYSNKFHVVVEFLSEGELLVVTAWRLS